MRLESAMPVTNRLVLDDGPFIHPLLELLDEGRHPGVVTVSAEGAQLLEWRAGSLQPVCRIEQEHVQAAHERAGQIGGGPAGQYHTPREKRQSRQRHRTQRFLEQVTTVAAELAVERGWERILVSGGERWTDPTVLSFPGAVRDKVIADDRILNGLNDAALATAVTQRFQRQHKERERHLLAQVRDAAGSGTAALGVSEVAAALNAGRVAHLVYDPQVSYTGSVGADGAVYGGDEIPPDTQQVTAEPRLTERLVERAMNTAARITPVEGAANGSLKDAAGIAALLRW
jgi:Bacterial archaeo-eukaryotic release factor family 10